MKAAGVALALIWGAGAGAARADVRADAVLAPMTRFAAAFNRGDVKAAAAEHVTAPTIVDDFGPHLWVGAGAFESWYAGLAAQLKAGGIGHPTLTLGAPINRDVGAASAYLVVPAHILLPGKAPMHLDGQFAVALKHAGTGWRIAAWAWSSPPPAPGR